MIILQINTTVNSGSHGRIVEDLGKILISKGHVSIIAYGRNNNESESKVIRVGNKLDIYYHFLKSRIFDYHGYGSSGPTKKLLKQIYEINPDLIHLHNLHGYYLNIDLLFKFLKKLNKPIVWTFHDCWPFTGHCSHFSHVNCNKWQTGCLDCPNLKGYPKSWLVDNSKSNYKNKKVLFNGLDKMALISPSEWLARHLKNSFLSGYPIKVINNGLDLNKFKPVNADKIRFKYGLLKKYIIGVANVWNKQKGLEDLINLRKYLDKDIEIVLVGLSDKQIKKMPDNIIGIPRTEDIKSLVALYSGAEVFINPTYADNLPSVNIEAIASGTPVITYNTGGSPEVIDKSTGLVVNQGDLRGITDGVSTILRNGKEYYTFACRQRAEQLFDKYQRFEDYIALYQNLIENH